MRFSLSRSTFSVHGGVGYLQEAHAVPVASYGSDHWPGFYTPTSGFKVKKFSLLSRMRASLEEGFD